MFTSSGTYLSRWGAGGNGNGRFSYPYGIATDGAGNVYVSDQGNNRIQKFGPGGTPLPIHTITASAGPHGTIAPSGAVQGVYLVTLEAGGRSVSSRVSLVR